MAAIAVSISLVLLPTLASAAWYDSNWSYRKLITVDHTQVGATEAPHPDFPLLISLVDGDLRDKARADGFDILFTAADGATKLDHELEHYLSGTGDLIAWVRIPSLSAVTDEQIYMYYGHAASPDQQNPTGVWASSFGAVWHLDEDAIGTGGLDIYRDSSANTNHGDDYVSASGQAGAVGNGQQLDGLDDYILVPTSSSLNVTSQVTLSAWVYSDAFDRGEWQEVMAKGANPPRQYLLRPERNTGRVQFAIHDDDQNAYYADSTNPLSNGAWHHIAGTYNGSTMKVYIDGYEDGSNSIGLVTIASSIHPLAMGRLGNMDYEYYQGSIDELRVSSAPRSAGWILTEFNNQKPGASFHSVAGEEAASNSISGRVFEDADFAGTASDWDGGINDTGQANVDVELYASGDAYLSSVTTDANGLYSFAGLSPGTYKVRVRSATLGDADTPPAGGLNATVPATWPYPLAEMTWGNGAEMIGGQDPGVDDTATQDNAGPGDTYVFVTVSGADISGVNLGFTYELVVSEADDGNAEGVRSRQGSLRQFIKNANAIAGVNRSWFQIPGL
jgi:hypothetical protein